MKILQSSLIIGLILLPALLFGYEIHYTDHIKYSAPTWTPEGKIGFIKSVSNSRKYVYGEEDKDVSGIFQLWHQSESISSNTYLCTMNIDGTEKKEIMKFPAKFSPGYISWGKELIVISEGGYPAKIATVRSNGKKFKIISEGSQGSVSPEGKSIVYVGIDKIDNLHYKNTGLWQMDTNGQNKVQLTDNPGDTHLLWSPDETMVAFERNIERKGKEIWVVELGPKFISKVTEGQWFQWTKEDNLLIDDKIYSLNGDIINEMKTPIILKEKSRINPDYYKFHFENVGKYILSNEGNQTSGISYFNEYGNKIVLLNAGTIEYGKRSRKQINNIWIKE